ncbi:MAG: winged helix-turn-helix transcriptional regulator [Methanoculleus thermophilus]|jgi:predicted transcriptional regulator|nr:winged helix-turn-helix transcriptional regulator [Methanoculleus thermophilus]
MVRWNRIFSILLVAVTLAGIALPGTATAGYAVESGLEKFSGEMHDFEEITFWDLLPRVRLLHITLMILPACFFPGELLYTLCILLPFGFRRVTGRTILDDDFRLDLYQEIAANPGVGARVLGKMVGVSRGRLRYHLDMLIREGKVAAVAYRNRTGYFARSQRHTDLQQRLLIALREETLRTILGHLLESPDTTRNDVAERLGLSGPTVSHHMQELEVDGIVAAERDGRFVRYRLSEGVREFLSRHPGDLPPRASRHGGLPHRKDTARSPEVLSG